MNAWELIKQRLAAQLSSESFDNWFGNTTYRESQGDILWVGVPTEAARQYIEQEFGEAIGKVVRDLRLPIATIIYEVAGSPHNGNGNGYAAIEPELLRLNPKFTFSSFVVGSCNQFAHAAAEAVATNPAREYNPLYIYGGVGMGKTHLMHAMGRSLLDNFPALRIVYTPAERFMNEMIASIREGRMVHFHAKYRRADVLMVDDVQVLGGKHSTQDEFFYTFNELYDSQKQIILTSDSPPNEITGLVERLRSRFSSGLMVDIQPPDLETKMAILEKKAAAEGIGLPDDVRHFIATKTKSNVRELEGALLKLIMQSSVTGSPVTLAMAQQALKHLVPGTDKRISIETIARAVATRYELQLPQLKQKTNRRQIARPRQIAMYLVKQLTPASLPEIGRWFGGKHHTTVLHSIEVIERLRQKDQDLNRVIQRLMDSLQ